MHPTSCSWVSNFCTYPMQGWRNEKFTIGPGPKCASWHPMFCPLRISRRYNSRRIRRSPSEPGMLTCPIIRGFRIEIDSDVRLALAVRRSDADSRSAKKPGLRAWNSVGR